MTGNRLDDPDLHPLDREEAAALLAQLSQRAGVVRRRRAIARIAGTVLPVLVVGGVLAWAVTSLVHLGHASQGPAGGSTTRRTSNPPPAVRAGDVIVFARASGEQIDATGDLWVIGVDGAGETKITDDPGDDTFPAWSPDGTRIVFGRCPSKSSAECDLYVVAPDGSGLTQLTHEPGWQGLPAWSPDGSQIAYVNNPGARPQIWVMDADGTGAHQATQESDGANHVAWSPDGEWLAYSIPIGIASHGGVGLVRPDGSDQHLIVTDPEKVFDLIRSGSWSPDGAWLAVTRALVDPNEGGKGSDIYLISADGSQERRLTDDGHGADAVWNRDGSRLLFTIADDQGHGRLYTMAPDGTDVQPVGESEGDDYQPAW